VGNFECPLFYGAARIDFSFTRVTETSRPIFMLSATITLPNFGLTPFAYKVVAAFRELISIALRNS
jgi:hypothetical protein